MGFQFDSDELRGAWRACWSYNVSIAVNYGVCLLNCIVKLIQLVVSREHNPVVSHSTVCRQRGNETEMCLGSG